MGLGVLPGDANFLFFTGEPALYDRLRAQGVLIRNCETYRGLGPGDCRIAVRTRAENEELLKSMGEALRV